MLSLVTAVSFELGLRHPGRERLTGKCARSSPRNLPTSSMCTISSLASPSVYYAARKFGVPVVQTLHNYRLLCPGATFFRNGSRCEDCTRHTVPWPAVLHGCYRRSMLQTGAVSLMISVHRLLQTWKRMVSLYIAVSEFEKRKFVEHGFAERKIFVKPNFVLDPGPIGAGDGDFLFVGRLGVEKGVGTLLRAMEHAAPAIRLTIVGDGPRPGCSKTAARNPRVRYLGRLPQSETLGLMASARCLILPSECYETFGRVAAEAFARGTPVIGSRIGAVEEIVDNGRTGILFTPGDAGDLANAMTWAYMNPKRIAEMRIEARNEYERKYTASATMAC